jgi:hypothetical protein
MRYALVLAAACCTCTPPAPSPEAANVALVEPSAFTARASTPNNGGPSPATVDASGAPAPAPSASDEAEVRRRCAPLETAMPPMPRVPSDRAAIEKMLRDALLRAKKASPPSMTNDDVAWCVDRALARLPALVENVIDTEALNTLGQISKNVAMAFERETMAADGGFSLHQICPPAAPVPPSLAQLTPRYASKQRDWSSDTGWSCLKFSIDDPQWFQYEVRVDASARVITAIARRRAGDTMVEMTSQSRVRGLGGDATLDISTSIDQKRSPAR